MGEVFNLRDYQSKKAVKADPKSIEETLAALATDTAPGEYVAPEKDPA